MRFYQIEGFRAHFRDVRDVVSQIMGRDGSIQLVLGIEKSGAWYILVPEHQIRRRPTNIEPPCASTRFTSLSPIKFQDLRELEVKLSLLKLDSRKMKQSRKSFGTARDTSEANNNYTMGFGNLKSARTIPYSFNSDRGRRDPRILHGEDVKRDPFITSLYDDASTHRSAFERSRVILRCVRNEIEPELYTISGPAWTGHFHRVVIFTATPFQYAQTGAQHRVALDYGWAELNTRNNEMALEHWEHIYLPSLFKISLQQGKFRGGHTKETGAVHESIQGFFSTECSKLTSKSVELEPSLLIVYNTAFTLKSLEDAGVDTSDWELGTSSLLYEPHQLPGGMSSLKEEEIMPRKVRSWSRSPDRTYSWGRDRSRSPPGRPQMGHSLPVKRRLAPMYVLDVMSLWAAMPGSAVPVPDMKEMAQTLGINCDATEWCAGNDVMTIRDIWLALSGGSAIDECSKEINIYNPPIPTYEEHESPRPKSDDDAIGVPGAVERLIPAEPNESNNTTSPENPLARYEAGGDDNDDDEW